MNLYSELEHLRPSDRRYMRNLIDTDFNTFKEHLYNYIDGWREADWVDDYQLQRVAAYVWINCSLTQSKEILETVKNASHYVWPDEEHPATLNPHQYFAEALQNWTDLWKSSLHHSLT